MKKSSDQKKIEQLRAELDIAVRGMQGWYKKYEECLLNNIAHLDSQIATITTKDKK